jgi:hypothetical protein
MSERRYSDEEIAAIFARATEEKQERPRQRGPGDGMTLSELQEIGREVGIEPEEVARAARSLDLPRPPSAPRFLGLPLHVAHSVELGYRMSDAQWEGLVMDLRETFDAPGRIRSDGAFRTWSNGNLQVLVEPSGEGDRVRFRTMKGQARSLMSIGLTFLAVSIILVVVQVVGTDAGLGEAVAEAATFLTMGAAMFTFGALQVPGWARLRQRQMEEIGARLLRLPPPLPKP